MAVKRNKPPTATQLLFLTTLAGGGTLVPTFNGYRHKHRKTYVRVRKYRNDTIEHCIDRGWLVHYITPNRERGYRLGPLGRKLLKEGRKDA